jgi:hypothetical protein
MKWLDKFVCLLFGHMPRRRFNLVPPGDPTKYGGGYLTYIECERCKEVLGP